MSQRPWTLSVENYSNDEKPIVRYYVSRGNAVKAGGPL